MNALGGITRVILALFDIALGLLGIVGCIWLATVAIDQILKYIGQREQISAT